VQQALPISLQEVGNSDHYDVSACMHELLHGLLMGEFHARSLMWLLASFIGQWQSTQVHGTTQKHGVRRFSLRQIFPSKATKKIN